MCELGAHGRARSNAAFLEPVDRHLDHADSLGIQSHGPESLDRRDRLDLPNEPERGQERDRRLFARSCFLRVDRSEGGHGLRGSARLSHHDRAVRGRNARHGGGYRCARDDDRASCGWHSGCGSGADRDRARRAPLCRRAEQGRGMAHGCAKREPHLWFSHCRRASDLERLAVDLRVAVDPRCGRIQAQR